MDVDAKPITTEDAVPLSGLSSCFAAAAADATVDSSAAAMAAATTAACGSSYCSSAVADGAAMAAATAVAIPSANIHSKTGAGKCQPRFLSSLRETPCPAASYVTSDRCPVPLPLAFSAGFLSSVCTLHRFHIRCCHLSLIFP